MGQSWILHRSSLHTRFVNHSLLSQPTANCYKQDETWDPSDKFTYREQFLRYLDRYDNREDTAVALPANNLLSRRTQGTEWFRKPTLPSQSSRSQSLSQSERSQSCELISEDGEQSTGATRQEGETYLSTPIIMEHKDFDLLAWWRENQATYPRLALVAKDILAIPIAGVGVERVFNIAKDIIGDRRHRLKAQTIRQLLVVKHGISDEDPDEDSRGLAFYQEPDDLFELPAQTEFHENSLHEQEEEDSLSILDVGNNIKVELQPPPRKRPRRSGQK